jgi:hypothetical protein
MINLLIVTILFVVLVSTASYYIFKNDKNKCLNVKMDKSVPNALLNENKDFYLKDYNLRLVDREKGLLPKAYSVKNGKICGNDVEEIKKIIMGIGRTKNDENVIVSSKSDKPGILLIGNLVGDVLMLRLKTVVNKCLNVKVDSTIASILTDTQNFDPKNFNIRFIIPGQNVLMAVPFVILNMVLCDEGAKVATSILNMIPGQEKMSGKAVISATNDNGGVTVSFTIEGNDLLLSFVTQDCINMLMDKDTALSLQNIKDFDQNSYGIRFISNGDFEKDFTPIVNNELCGVDLVSRLLRGMDNKAIISSRVGNEELELGVNAILVIVSGINGKTVLLSKQN